MGSIENENKKNKGINQIRHNTAEQERQQECLSQYIFKPFWEMELVQVTIMKGVSTTAS